MGYWYIHWWLWSCCWYVFWWEYVRLGSIIFKYRGLWCVLFGFSVLMHTGYCRPTASPPPSAIQELRAVIRVLPPQDCKSVSNIFSLNWFHIVLTLSCCQINYMNNRSGKCLFYFSSLHDLHNLSRVQ